MKLTPGGKSRDLGLISPTYLLGFFARTRYEAFNGEGILQMTHRFFKSSIDFSLQSGESIVGKIEWQIFCRCCAPETFYPAKKFDEIDL